MYIGMLHDIHVLAAIPIENKSFSDVVISSFEHLEFKRLVTELSELKLFVKDEKGNSIDNNGLPLSCVL